MDGIKLFLFPISLPYGLSEWWTFWIFMIFGILTWFTISSYSHNLQPFIPFSSDGRASLCLWCWWWLIPVPLYPPCSSLPWPLGVYLARGAQLKEKHKEHPQSWHSAEDSVVSLQSESGFVLNLELCCEFCFVPWVWLGQSHSLQFSQIILSSSILSVLLENEWDEFEESKPETS